jgi:hypothetical protein
MFFAEWNCSIFIPQLSPFLRTSVDDDKKDGGRKFHVRVNDKEEKG